MPGGLTMTDLDPSALSSLVQDLTKLLDKAGDHIEAEAEAITECFTAILGLPGLDTAHVDPIPGDNPPGTTIGWLYHDGDVRITRGALPATFTQAPHNHGGWNIFGVYRGAVKYRSYRRNDDGSRKYFADLSPGEDRILVDGDITI